MLEPKIALLHGLIILIEQCLMRAMKSQGGLTRGRGIGEKQRAIWLASLPICADWNHRMQDLCGLAFQSSEQHKEISPARQQRDATDIEKITKEIAICAHTNACVTEVRVSSFESQIFELEFPKF